MAKRTQPRRIALALAEPCFTTPHVDGYPAMFVRLGKIAARDLEGLLVDAWLTRALLVLAPSPRGRRWT